MRTAGGKRRTRKVIIGRGLSGTHPHLWMGHIGLVPNHSKIRQWPQLAGQQHRAETGPDGPFGSIAPRKGISAKKIRVAGGHIGRAPGPPSDTD